MRLIIWFVALAALIVPASAQEAPIKTLCAMICGTWDETGPFAPDQGSTRLSYRLAPDGARIIGEELTSGQFDGRPHPVAVILAIDPSTGSMAVTRTDEKGRSLTGAVTLSAGAFQIAMDAADGQSRMLTSTRFESPDLMVRRFEIVTPGTSKGSAETHFHRASN